MQNSLHKLIDDVAYGPFRVCCTDEPGPSSAQVTNIARVHEDVIFDMAGRSVCFHAGPLLDVYDIQIASDLVRLPFDNVWIEFPAPDNFKAVKGVAALLERGVEGIRGYIFSISRGGLFALVGGVSHIKVPSGQGPIKYRAVDCFAMESMNDGVLGACSFLSALNCHNVTQIEYPAPAKLNKKRQKKGKPPLFSTWTLNIKAGAGRARRDGMGGTHSSPRVHLRRGHVREFRPGKYCWVQPCVVGNPSRGMVHKDYAVTY